LPPSFHFIVGVSGTATSVRRAFRMEANNAALHHEDSTMTTR